MGDSGTSLGVGSELVPRIEPEFGVRSCVTQSRNKCICSIGNLVCVTRSILVCYIETK